MYPYLSLAIQKFTDGVFQFHTNEVYWWLKLYSAFPCGAYKGSAIDFLIILYLDYSTALILLANFKAQLLLGLSLPFSAIQPAAAGVVSRLRESTWTTREVGIFSFFNFNLNVCAAHRLGSPCAMRKTTPKTRAITWKLGEKTRQKSWLETVAIPEFEPGTFSWPPWSAPLGSV